MTTRRTTNWNSLRAERIASGATTEAAIAEAREEIAAEQHAYRLREIRKGLGLTQVDVATRLGVGQSRVSAIECGDLTKVQVGTLVGYLDVLGVHMEVTARVGEDEVRILAHNDS